MCTGRYSPVIKTSWAKVVRSMSWDQVRLDGRCFSLINEIRSLTVFAGGEFAVRVVGPVGLRTCALSLGPHIGIHFRLHVFSAC